MKQLNSIRNFSIIAHIDHGKTTLTDRFLELTDTVDRYLMHERFLDSHPISQERGVTIRLAPVRMKYSLRAETYTLNLIDTPGHIDFSYEVSRSLICCEGAILLVDASQGIQAQTLSHFQLAQKLNLRILPVVNKIDLSNSYPEKTAADLINSLGFKREEIIFVSAKTGENVSQVLEQVVKRIPPPKGNLEKPLRALIFDSFYHPHKGVVVYVKVFDGQLIKDKLKFLATNFQFKPLEIGFLSPQMSPAERISCGDVGYIATGLKSIELCRVGDTITSLRPKLQNAKVVPLPGYKEPKPMVFFDFYPINNKDFSSLEKAMDQLKLNDVALSFNPVGSIALGKGFRVGFLGIFHALITQERLEKDFGLEIIITSPSIEYQVLTKDGAKKTIQHASQLPDLSLIKEIKEPWIEVSIFTPLEFLGNIFKLFRRSRGKIISQKHFINYVNLCFRMPLIELFEGFYDSLKSASSGFASLDYHLVDFRSLNWFKLEVLINKEKIEPLSLIVNREKADERARRLAKRLKEVIPRQMFEVPIQITLNGRIVARETIKAFRKDVTAKLYGGDQTRKDKLLKKQKKGKKRMKQIGRISLSQEAFLAALRIK